MVALVLTSLVLLASFVLPFLPNADSGTLCGAICVGESVINFGNNAFYKAPLAGTLPLILFFVVSHAVPLFALYRQETNKTLSAIAIVAGSLLIQTIFGEDLAVWMFLAVLNISFLFGKVYERRSTLADYAVALPVAALLILMTGQLAIPAMLVAALFLLSQEHRAGAGLMSIAFCIAVLIGIVISGPVMPNYPVGAELVPGYNTADGLTPLIGDQLRPRTVNLALVRDKLLTVIPIVIAFLGFTTLLYSRVNLLAVTLGLVAILDSSLLPPFYAQLMPVQAVSRLIPGGQFYPISYLALAALMIISVSQAVASTGGKKIKEFVAAGGLVACCIAVSSLKLSFYGPTPPDRIYEEHAALEKRVSISPSYFAASSAGPDELMKRLNFRTTHFKAATNEIVSAISSIGQIESELLSDGKDSTAWHSGRGKQLGDEWLQIAFDQPVSAVRISAGTSFTDFPRGLRVRYISDCPMDRSAWNTAPVALNLDPNYGDIRITDAGYPYFSSQYEITAYLPIGVSARCYLVEQTGKDKNYGWSVAEVQIAEPLSE